MRYPRLIDAGEGCGGLQRHAGHQARSATPWINGLDLSHDSEIFHPNHTGVYTYLLSVHTMA